LVVASPFFGIRSTVKEDGKLLMVTNCTFN
jgi:hypothetical protein